MKSRDLLGGVQGLAASLLGSRNRGEIRATPRREIHAATARVGRECGRATLLLRLGLYGLTLSALLSVAAYASDEERARPAASGGEQHSGVNPGTSNPKFGNVTTIVGLDPTRPYGDGGPASKAILSHPIGLTIDAVGNMYIADSSNNRIRKVNLAASEPIITTVVGTGALGCIEGSPPAAALNQPLGVALDQATGTLFIADYDNQRIRRLDGVNGPDMSLTTIAGHGNNNFDCYYLPNYGRLQEAGPCLVWPSTLKLGDQPPVCDSTMNVPYAQSMAHTPATACGLFFPNSVAVRSDGQVWVADTDQHRIRRLTEQPFGNYEIATAVGGGEKVVPRAQIVDPLCVALQNPADMVEGLNGTLYVADTIHHLVLELGKDGIERLAGTGQDGFNQLEFEALKAPLNQPSGLAFEPPKGSVGDLGNIYVADTQNHRVRKLDLDSLQLSTIAGPLSSLDAFNDTGNPGGLGRPTAGFAGDHAGPNTATSVGRLFAPRGVALWGNDLYIADTLNNRVRRLSLVDNELTTVVGDGATKEVFDEGGSACLGRLYFPAGIAVDGCDLFILDHAHNRVVKVDRANDRVTTYAGTGATGHSGDGNGSSLDSLATIGRIGGPRAGIVLASDGTLYFNDATHYIRKVYRDSEGHVRMTTVAGCARWERQDCVNPVFKEGEVEAGRALLDTLEGIALDEKTQNLYIADSNHQRIWRVNLGTGMLSTWAGKLGTCTVPPPSVNVNDLGSCDPCEVSETDDCGDGGPIEKARFNRPTSLAWHDGELYIADQGNHMVRKASMWPAGVGIERVAGTGELGDDGDGGLATEARLTQPSALAVDPAGNLFVFTHSRIRMVDTKGFIVPVAGTGVAGFAGDGGPATLAQFDGEGGLAVDWDGSLLLTDTENNVVRRIERTPPLGRPAGSCGARPSCDAINP